MRIRFDKESGAFYITLREGKVHETLDLAEPTFGAYADIDNEGNVLGLEFLSFEEFSELTDSSAGGFEIPERIEDIEAFIARPEAARPVR
jgi:uncharacterized protein YuzE